MESIKLVIADDHVMVRDGLIGLLRSQKDFSVVGEAGTGLEAVEMAQELQPDVILIDIRMPELDGMEATRRIQAENPHIKVIILTTYDTDEYIFQALEAGAKGYLLKDSPREDLFHALRAVHHDKFFVDPCVAARVMNRLAHLSRYEASGGVLSHREVQVLRLIASGSTNKEVATALSITVGTVKTHVVRIFQKLDAKDRTEAVTKAVQMGIIHL